MTGMRLPWKLPAEGGKELLRAVRATGEETLMASARLRFFKAL